VNENVTNNPIFRRLVPPVAAVMAIVLFTRLGLWQLDRAAEEEALEASFASDASYRPLADVDQPVQFDKVETGGRLLGETQILIDNIVKNGQLGYYVITPLDLRRGEPLLLVNRGWVAREALQADRVDLGVAPEPRDVRGMIGNLPRVGIRGGPGFAESGADWPRIAVYPTAEEVSAELERPVLPHVLLLDPEEPSGFLRDWRPPQGGAATNYGYAFQWFAMAAAVVAIAFWQLKKRRSTS